MIENLYDTPLALSFRSDKAREFVKILQDGPPEQDAALMVPIENAADERPYELIQGVAILPIEGVLTSKDSPYWWCMETSYPGIRRRFDFALNDPEVKAIALHICSPGGEVSGCFDLVDYIYEARGQKPIWSICDDYAFSAAYAIASAADYITVPRNGYVGSIGVITMHINLSKMLDQCGIDISIIQFGKHKSDYSPFKPLSKDAEKNLQEEVNKAGDLFVATVARNRGMGDKKVKDTEAQVYGDDDGVEYGLADAVMSAEEAFISLVASITESKP